MVFMDDSPFERGLVGAELPGVALVAADGDPAYLVGSLLRRGWFDVPDLTDADRQRPELYRSRATREEFSGGFESAEAYLSALNIQLTAAPVTEYTAGRVAQLAARTNQFNLTGVRFDEAQTMAMRSDPGHLVASFAVADRFGSEGIVGAVWVERNDPVWHVLNLVLSCRVLGRGVETAMVAWLARQGRTGGAAVLEGRYVPSAKNGAAAGFWERAGFSPAAETGTHTLDLTVDGDLAPAWISIRDEDGP
jgi:FkbH-like protein